MFVFSVKTTRSRVIATVVVLMSLIGTVLVMSCKTIATPSSASVNGMDDTTRRQYLQSLGYEVGVEEATVREILIPVDFDDAFTAYNQLQKEAGTDLNDYRGKRVKCWTYTVTNVPEEAPVLAHLYVYKNEIIGGDVSSTRQDGFCHGLVPLTSVSG